MALGHFNSLMWLGVCQLCPHPAMSQVPLPLLTVEELHRRLIDNSHGRLVSFYGICCDVRETWRATHSRAFRCHCCGAEQEVLGAREPTACCPVSRRPGVLMEDFSARAQKLVGQQAS